VKSTEQNPSATNTSPPPLRTR